MSHSAPVSKDPRSPSASGSKKTYTIKHVAAGTLGTVIPNQIFTEAGPPPLKSAPARVSFSRTNVPLSPGKKATITVTFTAPPYDPSWPVYSGWVVVEAEGLTRRISYTGVAGKLRDKQVVDNTADYFGVKLPAIADGTGDFVNPSRQNTTYTFKNGDQPMLVWRLAFGTPRIHVHLVSSTTTVKSTLSARKRSL